MRPVAITGLGTLGPGVTGGRAALARYLAAPASMIGAESRTARLPERLVGPSLADLVDETEARRLSRVCQLTLAAARLALADARLGPGADLGVVVGTEFGDLHATAAFADGYLAGGVPGLSALLFPSTVMNTMAATTTIAVGARELSLTVNAPTVAGELAVARAAHEVAAGRLDAVLAGGVDQLDDLLIESLAALGAGHEARGEGATFVVLEAREAARARGAAILGEVQGVAWRALPARPHGVGRHARSRAIAAALEAAAAAAPAVGWVYGSASGDVARDAWEANVLDTALGPGVPRTSLAAWLGRHSGVGALGVAAAAWTAGHGRLAGVGAVRPGPGLVHALARGGSHVALVVAPGDEEEAWP
jgi:3-oxoacyl-(acyl-carrier-protein) synthase